jgi:hypothetical protein
MNQFTYCDSGDAFDFEIHTKYLNTLCWKNKEFANVKSDQKYLENFKMWCWKGGWKKISWTDRVRNEGVLQRVKEKRNILHTVKGRKANWVGQNWRKNCLLQHVIEGKVEGRIEVTGRGGRKCKQLLYGLKEKRGYCKLKGEAQARAVWRTHFGGG